MESAFAGGGSMMYFDGVRERILANLAQPRSLAGWLKDRVAFPWLALASSTNAIENGFTPLDLERFRMVLPWIQGRLLDIGCGDNVLVEAYGSGIGADIVNWGQVDVLLPGDGTLPFASQSFDTVTILAALNHIPERERLLTECYRVLTPNGRLIITMLTPWVSRVTHRVRRKVDPDQTHRHQELGEVWGISRREMEQLLRKAGFELTITVPFVWSLNRLYVARSASPRIEP